jgi:hypothetical protein
MATRNSKAKQARNATVVKDRQTDSRRRNSAKNERKKTKKTKKTHEV